MYLSIALEYDPNNSRALQFRAMLQHSYCEDFTGAIVDWQLLTQLADEDVCLKDRAIEVRPSLVLIVLILM